MCIKVSNLRNKGYDNLQEWMERKGNIYVGRRGRIFIGTGQDKKIFHYKESKWANPYNLKQYSLEDSLRLYHEHLFSSGLIYQINELKGMKLGCFCSESKDDEVTCHAMVLERLLTDCYKCIKPLIEKDRKIKSDSWYYGKVPENLTKKQLISFLGNGVLKFKWYHNLNVSVENIVDDIISVWLEGLSAPEHEVEAAPRKVNLRRARPIRVRRARPRRFRAQVNLGDRLIELLPKKNIESFYEDIKNYVKKKDM